jgi:KUP system potassium uptake protein
MGHCGRKKHYESAGFFVKSAGHNYFGQAAYLIHHEGSNTSELGGKTEIFLLVWPTGQPIGIVIANTCCGSTSGR